ncbi:MAG: hypothetical protein HFH04_10050 [Dorea sp.]|nr:hypothetical protein [Dorea sp.]
MMRKLLNLCGMALIAATLFFPASVDAAGKNVCETLKPSKTYQYNLDQKGKKESIKVNISKKEYEKNYDTLYDVSTTVTVNGKKIYNKILKKQDSDQNHVKVMVTDVNKKDKQMELLIIEGDIDIFEERKSAWVADMEHIYYYQYANGKAKRKQDLAPLFKKNFKKIHFLHGMKDKSFLTISGKSEIYARICTEVQKGKYMEDCLHVKTGLTLKNGKFLLLSSKSYAVLDVGGKWDDPVKAKKNLTAYTKMGGKKKAFIMKKGERIPAGSQYCMKNKKVYLKIKNKKGKWGYIELKEGIFFFDGVMHA